MPEEQAPPVVAVVVACDPDRWFEECLQALDAQDYPNLDVLVVDAASREPLTGRVAAVLPRAFICRQSENRGFSAAANEALAAVEGASHLLLCHDDVAPASDAVRHMVEEAFRSNAGIVGPKLVEWDAPDRLLQVGLSVDRFAAAFDRVEAGELDQAQHDEVREVFAVPGGCTLVRADLFRALGGFDADMDLFGEDVDLCWRAHVAGARVVIAPSARVRHLAAAQSGLRQVGDVAALRRRHALRAVLKNYDWPRRVFARTQLAAASVVEILVAFFQGDHARSQRVTGAWRWNRRHRSSLKAARRALRVARQQPDRDVARLFVHGGRRPVASVRVEPASGEGTGVEASTGSPAQLETAEATVALFDSVGRATETPLAMDETELGRALLRRSTPVAPVSAGWAVAGLVVVVGFGVRNLLLGHLPLVGQLLPFPPAPRMLSEFFSGWQDAGWHATGPAPTGFGMIGLAGAVLFGSTAQALKLLLLVPLLVGALGVHRLLRPLGSGRARLAGTIAYLGLPLLWNDISAGDLQALVTFAGIPFVLGRLCRATRLQPFASVQDAQGWRGVVSDVVPFGLLLAVMVSLAPPSVLAVAALSLGIALGSVAAGHVGAALRAAGVAVGATAVAFLCCFPWSLTFVQRGARWSVLGGAVSSRSGSSGILRLFRFDVGPVGAGWLGWGLVLGAGFVLLVAREVRLDWATRWWVAAITSVVVAYAGAVGWLGAGGGATRVLLAPAACCLAGAVGLGVAAFEVDLVKSRFGWRQNLSASAALCLIVGLFPTLVSMVDGRSSLPSVGYGQLLGWTSVGSGARGYDVLWLGDPASLPPPSWQVRPGLAFAVSVDGLPDGERLWPSANPGVGSQVEDALIAAEAGLTVRLGAALARAGVRYVIVPEAVAPVLPGVQVPVSVPPPPGLVETLQVQSDLRQLPTEGAVMAFENTAWPVPGSPGQNPILAGAGASGQTPGWLRSLGLAGGLLVVVLGLAEGVLRRRRRRYGAGRGGKRPPDGAPDPRPRPSSGQSGSSEGVMGAGPSPPSDQTPERATSAPQ